MQIAIEFRIMLPALGEPGQLPVEQLDPALLLEALLAQPSLSCCSFQGGYCLFVDGIAWNGETDSLTGDGHFTFDEYWMTISWLNALQRLLAGESGPILMPYWEESRAEMSLYGDLLTLVDKHHTGEIYPEVILPLEDFFQALCGATESYLIFWERFGPVLAGTEIPAETRELILKEMQPESFRDLLVRLQGQRQTFQQT